jgi:pimeloyl-ACP methyl ester carboxylesterase
MFDRLIHQYLRVPYALHVHTVRRVKRPRATVLFLHGIGGSGAAWDAVIAGLPRDINVISVDLLGFGQSPHPRWATYSTSTQARSVVATLLRLKLKRRLIIVGHSMGSLVAIEVAKRYPLIVRSLILCSPPFYSDREARRLLPDRERDLKRLYRLIQKYPRRVPAIAALAVKARLVDKGFNVTDENVDLFLSALQASILNQTSFDDAKQLNKPMHILHGVLDPVVIKKNLEQVVAANKHARLTTVLAGHTVQGPYVPAVVKEIASVFTPKTKAARRGLRNDALSAD